MVEVLKFLDDLIAFYKRTFDAYMARTREARTNTPLIMSYVSIIQELRDLRVMIVSASKEVSDEG